MQRLESVLCGVGQFFVWTHSRLYTQISGYIRGESGGAQRLSSARARMGIIIRFPGRTATALDGLWRPHRREILEIAVGCCIHPTLFPFLFLYLSSIPISSYDICKRIAVSFASPSKIQMCHFYEVHSFSLEIYQKSFSGRADCQMITGNTGTC